MEAWYPGIGGGPGDRESPVRERDPVREAAHHLRQVGGRPAARAYFRLDSGPLMEIRQHWAADDQQRQSLGGQLHGRCAFRIQVVRLRRQDSRFFPLATGFRTPRSGTAVCMSTRRRKPRHLRLKMPELAAARRLPQVYVGLPKASGVHSAGLPPGSASRCTAGSKRWSRYRSSRWPWRSFDVKKDAWAWVSGKYTVFVGGSSRDLPLGTEVALY